jgi:hypothetical protein
VNSAGANISWTVYRSRSRFDVFDAYAAWRAPMARDGFDDFKKFLIGGWEE